MAFVEPDECISIFSLFISFFFFFFLIISFLDFMSRIAVIWIILCLSHLCHAYMCSYVGRKFVIKILVSCILYFYVLKCTLRLDARPHLV